MKKIIVVLLLFHGLYGFSQEQVFEKGKVIDNVPVSGTDESYALYLPKNYDPNTLSSAIFIFDPSAQGKQGVSLFVEAAERYNHILICSNQTRNHIKNNFDIINRLFNTVFSTFNIDENQVYTAGFSGGSRLASTVAVLTNKIEGVIACGAGLSPTPDHTPNPSHSFSYVGLVGALDMNYHEMYNTQVFLQKMNLENELFTNDDPHKWPEPSQLAKAIGFLELQAYKKNRKPKNDALIQLLYEEWYLDGKRAEGNSDFPKAVEEYERLKRNFGRYYNLDSITQRIARLKKSKEYKRQEKLRGTIEGEEERVKMVFFDRFQREISAKTLPKKWKWWEKEVQKLREDYSEASDAALKQLGARVENMLFAAAIETANNKLIEKDVEKAIYCHRLLEIFSPEAPYPQFLLAKDYALLNDKTKMLEHLYSAKEKGLSERKYIDGEDAFQRFRNDREFTEFVNGLK
ncbi:hypothetical protein POV27_19330 [Aureisphaera galaxeae]|uniref:hypothetical protein n=1 Tax=Aureisphaera galaxeae TaxID=1538023 RepID=UPI002350AF58|nr:hypothetical protein [Aureisphaera galaxeae]MDC8006214.1 hypothetical protein [Aureisphaera galaxeae]